MQVNMKFKIKTITDADDFSEYKVYRKIGCFWWYIGTYYSYTSAKKYIKDFKVPIKIKEEVITL